MDQQRISLHAFLHDPAQGLSQGLPLLELLLQLADTVKELSALIAQGALADLSATLDSLNIQGETQLKLDLVSNALFIEKMKESGLVHGLASEELDDSVLLAKAPGDAPFLLIFDPLDGSSNVSVNVSIGSIFSVLSAPQDHLAHTADYLQAGRHQLAAAYAVYGPATMLVLTFGQGTHGFTLDTQLGEFVLTHPHIRIPAEAAEFAINASNERYWPAPIKRYIDECKAGAEGARGKNFNMRWVASMVADIHRILMRGGIYLYPADSRPANKQGRLRLMYEANPMAMLIEQAGGKASTGTTEILQIKPDSLHQRIPVIMGSSAEVQRVERYLREA